MRNMSGAAAQAFDFDHLRQAGDFDQWKHAFRESLRNSLGLRLAGELTAGLPLRPVRLECFEEETHIREKWRLQSEPDIMLPFYLLLPKRQAGPFPVVIAPHGHECGKEAYAGLFDHEEKRMAAEAIDQMIGIQAVKEGYAAVVPNVRGFGEMSRIEEASEGYKYPLSNPYNRRNSCEELQRRSLFYGRTLTGDRVHDMTRILDFVGSHSMLDSSRIVMVGNSTGGSIALFTAACDERISLAVPSCCFCSIVGSSLQLYHCSCCIVPGLLQLGELADVAGLIAPRPLLMISGERDDLFPVAGAKAAFARLRSIYEYAGANNNCEHDIGSAGHRFYKNRAWPFVREHLERMNRQEGRNAGVRGKE